MALLSLRLFCVAHVLQSGRLFVQYALSGKSVRVQEAKGILYCYKFTPSNATGTVLIEELSRGKLHRHVTMTSLTRDQLLVLATPRPEPAATAPVTRPVPRSRQRPTSDAAASAPSSSPSRKRRSVEANADYQDLFSEMDLDPDLEHLVPEVLPAGVSDHELELYGAPYDVPHENASSQFEQIIPQSPDTDEFASILESELLDDTDPAQLMHQHGSRLSLQLLLFSFLRLTRTYV